MCTERWILVVLVSGFVFITGLAYMEDKARESAKIRFAEASPAQQLEMIYHKQLELENRLDWLQGMVMK